jgi:hypothetical protein
MNTKNEEYETLGYFIGISESVTESRIWDEIKAEYKYKVVTCLEGQTGRENIKYSGNKADIACQTFLVHFMRIYSEMMLEGEET